MILHCVRIKTGPLKKLFIIQQNRGTFVWNFRHTNNRANQQEKTIFIETYKTLPVLWTFKMKHSKYKVSNKTVSDCQWSKFRLHSWCSKCLPCFRTHNRSVTFSYRNTLINFVLFNESQVCLFCKTWWRADNVVFWGPTFFPESQWEHPNGGVKCKGVWKSCNFRPISRYSSKTVEDRWYMLLCVWPALNSLSIHVTFSAIVPGAYPYGGGQNMP